MMTSEEAKASSQGKPARRPAPGDSRTRMANQSERRSPGLGKKTAAKHRGATKAAM